METLDIHRLHARYHLTTGAGRERLDGILGRVAGDSLTAALERHGMPSSSEICIRSVDAPLRVQLDAADAAIERAWCDAIAAAIADAVTAGGANAVVYASPAHALRDLARSVAGGDVTRAWAWRQVGLWHAPEGAVRAGDRGAAAAALVETLLARPASIVAVLVDLARAGLLERVAVLVPAAAWPSLAAAALAAAGATRDAIAAVAGAAEATRGTTGAADGTDAAVESEERLPAHVAEIAAVVARTSALAAAVVATGEVLVVDPHTRIALAALATLEAERAIAVASPWRAAALVGAVAEGLFRDAAGVAPVDGGVASGRGDWEGRRGSADTSAEDDARSSPVRSDSREPGPAAGEKPLQERHERDVEVPLHHRRDTSRSRETATDMPDADRPAADAANSAAEREAARTRWGGLLFLLHVLDELRLPKELALARSPRPLRWRLHRLALAIAPLEADDAAALAFAGLPPDENPFEREAPPTDEELDEAAGVAHRCIERVAERLDRVDDDRVGLVASVCMRDAEIGFDPGWIDVRLALADVSLDVRRAGLDLDPGYVPWLGTVVRFVYE